MSSTPTLGNDIVDRGDDDNLRSAQRLRYAQRVLSGFELEHWRAAPDPSHWLLALWAAKEAWHKAVAGHGQHVVFAPRRRCVARACGELTPQAFAPPTGTLERAAQSLRLRWDWNEDFVHCLVYAAALKPQWRVSRRAADGAGAGAQARALAVALYCERAGATSSDVEISRRAARHERPRLVEHGQVRHDTHVSLSHDGRFVACAVAR